MFGDSPKIRILKFGPVSIISVVTVPVYMYCTQYVLDPSSDLSRICDLRTYIGYMYIDR